MKEEDQQRTLTTPLDAPVRHRKTQEDRLQAQALKRLNEWLKENAATLFKPVEQK